MKIIHYTVPAAVPVPITVALVADLHDRPTGKVLASLRETKPDCIAIAGDLTNVPLDESPIAIPFLRAASSIAPTFYSLGNHEMHLAPGDYARIMDTGVRLLDDTAVPFRGITVGGLTSGYRTRTRAPGEATPPPNLTWLRSFAAQPGYRILLCHHPEYYDAYLRETDIPLILAGHAHGGQIRLFGRGLFAPGQGLFPRYTRGIYDGRLAVSPGLANTGGIIPRLGNPTALLYIHLKKQTENEETPCTTN